MIGGQNASREFLTRTLDLPPYTRREVDGDFYSVVFVHVKSRPDARLGIYSPSRKETYLVDPGQWSNIWIYGMDIYLTGWISRAEFRQRASLGRPRVLQGIRVTGGCLPGSARSGGIRK